MAFATPNMVSQVKSRPYASISITRALFPPKGISGSPFRVASPSRRNHYSFTIYACHTDTKSIGRVLVQSTSTAKVRGLKKADPMTESLKAAEEVKQGLSTFKNKVIEIETLDAFDWPKSIRKEVKSPSPQFCSTTRKKLDLYDILKYPVVTESAMKKIEYNNTLVFMVDMHANKKNIKDAFEKMFDIQTKKVNTLINYDGTKKAYVMLTRDSNALDVANKFKII